MANQLSALLFAHSLGLTLVAGPVPQAEFRPPACAETVLASAEALARRAAWLPAAQQRDIYLSAVPKAWKLSEGPVVWIPLLNHRNLRSSRE